MKKCLMLILTALAVLVSCVEEPILPDVEPEKEARIVFKLTANHLAETKAVKTGWESGDAIFVFFSGAAAPKHLKMVYNGSSWVCTEYDGATQAVGALGLENGNTGMMRAVFLPFGNGLTVSNSGSSFTFSEQQCSYYLTATLAYSVSENTVSGAFDMRIPDGYVQFFVDNDAAAASDVIELREPHLTPQGIASIAAGGAITHTSIAHGAPLKGYVYDKAEKATGEHKGYLFSGILAEGARGKATDYNFTLVSGGWEGSYYSKAFTAKSLAVHSAVKLPAISSWKQITDYKPIDLGFDLNGKRLYWSSRNVGATSDVPAENTEAARKATYGNYYAWAATKPSASYNWASCPYWYETNAGEDCGWLKYCEEGYRFYCDYLTVLEPMDDAARQVVGGIWRMPTQQEWDALINKANWTWHDEYNGRIVTSRVSGYDDGRFIFLPAAGEMDGTELWGEKDGGYYWSASLETENAVDHSAYNLLFSSDELKVDWETRPMGLSVRPITE